MTKDQAAAAPDLLPCPFCGGPAEHRKPYNRIECTSVECRPMPAVRAHTLAEAVSHWNRRAPITPAVSEASPVEAPRREAIEEAAEKARSHLENWAGDLAATRDQYIDAAACGMFNGRRITEEQARLLARQFRERAEAVSESAEHTAAAIRSLK